MSEETRKRKRGRHLGAIALRTFGGIALLLLAALAVLALVPVSVGGARSTSNPASSYADAVSRFGKIRASERREGVYAPCSSRLLDHGRQTGVVVVLVHSLSNCPREMLELGETIHATGANVLILRAPRHGIADDGGQAIGSISNLSGLTPGELSAYGDQAVDIAAGLGRDVRVLGLSMGGVVAAWIAQNRADVDRVVAVAPALSLPRVPGFVDGLFRNLFGRLPNVSLPGSDAIDHAYDGESTRALAATFRLAESVLSAARQSAPAAGSIALVTNDDDGEVDNGEIRALAETWRDRGTEVTTYEFPRSLGLPHDLVDERQTDARPELVYPTLLGLLGFGG